MSRPNSARPRPGRKAGGRPTLLVGISGASGAAYAVRLVECAVEAGRQVHLVVTAAGRMVLADEVLPPNEGWHGHSPPLAMTMFKTHPKGERLKHGHRIQPRVTMPPAVEACHPAFDLASLWPAAIARHVTYTPAENIAGPPASGSFPAEAMVVVPCSMNTLAALAHGLAGNLLQRAAYVTLKEGRPLVVVPREMPLSMIDFDNMARLAAAGAAVMPAMPAFYHRPETVADLVDFVVAKVLDRLKIEHELSVRWRGSV